MLKYVNCEVVFAEIPDEISLAINISNCPCKCSGCHSPYLAEDIGTELNEGELEELIKKNKGITCISFMGGDADPFLLDCFAEHIRTYHPEIKTAWYSGRQELSSKIHLHWWNYIKLGPYMDNFGPLNNPNTNQIMYKIVHENGNSVMVNITNKFWEKV